MDKHKIKCLVGLILGCLFIFAPLAEATTCQSFCDDKNNWHEAFPCKTSPDLYCCGTKTFRYCCANSTLDISNNYPSICECPNYECAYDGFQAIWGALLFILTTAILILVCCKVCIRSKCRLRKPRNNRRPGSGSPRVGTESPVMPTISSSIETGQNSQSNGIFNPAHPFAFSPPAYDSIAKDLPKYEEIFNESNPTQNAHSGFDNLAYDGNENQQTNQHLELHQQHPEQIDGEMALVNQSEDSHRGQDIQSQENEQRAVHGESHQGEQQFGTDVGRRQQQQQQQQPHTQLSFEQSQSTFRGSRLIVVSERSDTPLGPPEGSPPPTPPPPYEV